MRGKTILLCIAMMLIFLSMPKVMAQPLPPCVFFGDVNVGGNPAPDGLIVTARIIGISLNWTTVTKDGTYVVSVPSDNVETSEKDGGKDGYVIVFYISGVKTGQTATFGSGSAKEVDLSISEIPNGPKSDSDSHYLLYAAILIVAVSLIVILFVLRKRYQIRIRISRKT
jgi:hypothetical protein